MKIDKKLKKSELNNFLLVSNKYNSKENFEKIDRIKIIINELEQYLGKETLKKIMQTHKDYFYGLKFLEFLDLHRAYDANNIAKILNLNNTHLVKSWYRRFPPRPIRTLLNIYFNAYHKINKTDLSYIFGWGFGDGGINKELAYYFICGKRHDLDVIKSYLSNIMSKTDIIITRNEANNTIKLHNGKERIIAGYDTWILYIIDSSFAKLLYSLGLPKGQKVLQKTEIPEWIIKGNLEIKKAFLTAIFECEMQTHKVQFNHKRNKVDICPVSFSMNKVEEYKINLLDFFNQIRYITNELSIKTSEIEKFRPSIIRKDNKKTYSARFFVSTSAENTIQFSKMINYPFNKEKREALINATKEAKIKIKNMENQLEKYNNALELHKRGLNINKIAKIINIEWHTANNWINKKEHLPILLNQKKFEATNNV